LVDHVLEIAGVVDAAVVEVAAGVGGIPEPVSSVVARSVGDDVEDSPLVQYRLKVEVIVDGCRIRGVPVQQNE
jgi:hypothetical protein